MRTVGVAVHAHESFPVEAVMNASLPDGIFPVITGDFGQVNSYVGRIPAQDNALPLGLHKPAQQHHRSAVITAGSKNHQPIEVESGQVPLVVTAKGINMSHPVTGITTDSEDRPYATTYGLMGIQEIDNQFIDSNELRGWGVRTERLLGCLVIDEYILHGQPVTHAEFAEHALKAYLSKIANLTLPPRDKNKKEQLMYAYVQQPHVILLRATESALRLADVQDAPRIHQTEMLHQASQDTLQSMKITDYFIWLQERLAASIVALHNNGVAHRALYHGGNITTNGEIVDLDTIRRASHYPSREAFDAACLQDAQDVAANIEYTQTAYGLSPDSALFKRLAG